MPKSTSSRAAFDVEAKVSLLVEGKAVANAVLQAPSRKDFGKYCTVLHGHWIKEFEEGEEDLVVIKDTTVYDGYKHVQYPYRYKGVEEPPKTLLGMVGGFHAWDLNAMQALKQEVPPDDEVEKVISSSGTGGNTAVTLPGKRQQNSNDEETLEHAPPSPGLAVRAKLRSSQSTESGACAEEDVVTPVRRVKAVQGEGSPPVGQDSSSDDDLAPLADRVKRFQGRNSPVSRKRKAEQDMDKDSSEEEEGERDYDDKDYVAPNEGPGKRRYTYKSRTKRAKFEGPLSEKRRKAAEELDGVTLKSLICCMGRRCFQSCDDVFLKAESKRVFLLGNNERKQFLQGLFEPSSRTFMFCGKTVCYTFLEIAFGFSRDLQSRVKGTPANQVRAESVKVSRAAQRDSIICFLERLAESTADFMPDSAERHLPYFQKSAVYDLFVKEFRQLHKGSVPTSSYFYSAWTENCPSIKVRKVHRFAKCTECETLRDELGKAGTNQKMAKGLLARRAVHTEMVRAERREYQQKSERACLYPKQFTSLIIDGADQSAFGLPHFPVSVKAVVGKAIKAKLVGVLEHGLPKRLSLFTMTAELETGANHIVEALHRTLMRKWEQDGKLQGTLYVQVDNCTRENKNTYFFSYAESLVAWGVYEEVFVSFLPIGHTHADIDQTFSCTSRRLKTNAAVTMEDLMDQLRKSYTPEPHVSRMLHVANFSGLCKQEDCIGRVEPFSQYRYFRFHRRSGNPVTGGSEIATGCSVKVGCRDEWKALETFSDASGFILFPPDLSRTPPTKTTSPTDLKEVNDRIRSEEHRINDRNRMKSLQELREHVYQSRLDPFHWNLDKCFERRGKYGGAFVEDVVIDGDGQGPDTEDEDLPKQDLQYTLNYFVAVKGEGCTKEMPFWLGQILATSKDKEGATERLSIQWYEVYDNKDVWRGKYRPAKFGDKGSRRLWQGIIHVNTVYAEFEKLTKKRIGRGPARRIREALNEV